MGILRKLAGESAVYGLSSILGRFLNYLLVPLHTHVFTNPGEYGAVTEIYAYISFLVIVYTYGMETSFFHFARKYPDKTVKVFGTGMMSLLVSTLVFSGSLVLFSDSLAETLNYQAHPEYIVYMALIIGFDALTAIPFAKLRQEGKARKFAALKLFGIGINISFNVLFFLVFPVWMNRETGILFELAKQFYNPETGAGYVFIANLLASVATLLVMLPSLRFRISDWDVTLWREQMVYALPLLFAGLAGMVNETLDRALIRHLVTDKQDAMVQLGIYGACYKLSILMTLFIQAFRYAAEPFFFSQFGKDDAKDTYARVTKYFCITCAIVFLGVMLYIDIFKHFIGEPYRVGLGVVPILLLANMCLGIFFNLSMWYKMTGKTRYGMFFTIFGAAITVALNVLLVPSMGYMGAAWATLGCYACMMVASFLIGQRNYPVPYETNRILAYIGLAIACYFVSDALLDWLEVTSAVRLLLNTIVFVGYLLLMGKWERPPVFSK
ncbi:MAG: polysaccharide biosynthesis C-terminal domain-containing protein [Bacteroidota bacterium]